MGNEMNERRGKKKGGKNLLGSRSKRRAENRLFSFDNC